MSWHINQKCTNKKGAHEVQKRLFNLKATRLVILKTLWGLLDYNDTAYDLESGAVWDQLKNYTKYLVSTYLNFFIRFLIICDGGGGGVNKYCVEWKKYSHRLNKPGGLHTA
jgi:hypothetical protein